MRPGRSGERGYNLVVVVMLITVMSILTAIALPLWSTQIRRDKEEELISRGLQYAEAIRVFQRRFGRLPVRLAELIEVEPRSIRRLWKDPMTGEADWALILDGKPARRPPATDPETGEPVPGDPPTGEPPEGEPEIDPETGEPKVLGPIRGVRSRSDEEGLQLYFDRSRYDEWEFKVDVLLKYRARPGDNGLARLSAMTLGRPFRFPTPGDFQAGGGLPPPAIGPVPPSPLDPNPSPARPPKGKPRGGG